MPIWWEFLYEGDQTMKTTTNASARPSPPHVSGAAQLRAGVAKADITDTEAGPVNDPLYVKALVLKDEATAVVIVTVDAVAIGEIGYIKNDYLTRVRSRLNEELNIQATNVLINV
jgi:hypothetical protein